MEKKEKKKGQKLRLTLTSGSLHVYLITKMSLETELWKLKTHLGVFNFHNSSLKNQRIEWWKQKLETEL